jgi:hypothetical protein
VLRVVVHRVDLHPLRRTADPVVLRGITLAPKHGVPVVVERIRPADGAPAVAGAPLARPSVASSG